MALQKRNKTALGADRETLSSLHAVIDNTLRECLENQSQLEVYYIKKAEELQSIDPDCSTVLIKRFQKASLQGKDILVKILKSFQSVELIQFLQNFIRNEPFLPRTGLEMLDVLNKSDAILDEGVTSRLLEYDSLTQRIKQRLTGGELDQGICLGADIVHEFLARSPNDHEGIICQIMQEATERLVPLLIAVMEHDKGVGRDLLRIITRDPTPESMQVLQKTYKVNKNKNILKLMKKTAHALKQKGVSVSMDVHEKPSTAVFKRAPLPEPQAFVSRIDPEGYRLIIMVKPITPHENKVFNLLVSDFHGVHDIEVVTAIRKDAQAFINKMLSNEKADFIVAPLDYAVFLVDEACTLSESRGNIVSANIAQWKDLFGQLSGSRTQTIIYDRIPQTQSHTGSEIKACADAFLKQPEVVLWFVATDEAREQWMKMTNMQCSPLVLNDSQKEERAHDLQLKTVQDFFNDDRQRIFKRRLEEIAYYFSVKGQEELAQNAVCLASTFSRGMPPAENPFCVGIVRQGFEIFRQASQQQAKAPPSTPEGRTKIVHAP